MKTTTSFFSNLSNLEKILVAILGLLIGCLLCIIPLRSVSNFLSESGGNDQPNNPIPTQIRRPDYGRMLESNGFEYRMNDENGDPIYVSPCGCVVTVKQDYVGFAAKYYPDNQCPIADMGAIVRIIYPSDVIDFIASNMNEVIVKDTTVHGTAAGYRINIDFDPYDPKLIMTIEDPR